ncbi:serine O-acetyltransferase [Pontibacter sp. CAU 1760]
MQLINEIKLLKGNSKGLFFIIYFRLSSYCARGKLLSVLGFPIRLSYKIFIQWILGIDIPDTTQVGLGLNLYHGQGIVIHKNVIIKNNVIIRQNTTIGNSKYENDVPVICDNVQIGASVVIIGKIVIGEKAIIGAGSVVTKDVPPFAVVAGNPAKVLKYLYR